ncbi:MAG: serpin family protein [Candidatus Krumholzibacteriia bacterium]
MNRRRLTALALLPMLLVAAACNGGGGGGTGDAPADSDQDDPAMGGRAGGGAGSPAGGGAGSPAGAGTGSPADAGAPSPAELAAASNAFAWDLYGRLAEGDGNLFFSPFSVEVALAMTLAGARGETAAEMRQVLHLPALQGAALHEAVAQWQQTVVPDEGDTLHTLTMANRLWGQQGAEFAPEFLATTREHYDAELGQVDFRGAPAEARRSINDWIAEQTRGHIEDLIPAGVLDERTRLVLTNAIYFLGTWQRTFNAAATRDEPFFAAGGDEVTVPLMTQEERFRYAEAEGAQVLELPYRSGRGAALGMVVILPRDRDGLGRLSADLTADTLRTWLDRLEPRRVRVHLPRFDLSATMRLTNVLREMGMSRPFSHDADFSAMTAGDGEPLAITDVLHKGWVKVDEKGTEAAAATGVVVGVTSVPPREEPVVFRADHPFIFLIRDGQTGTILFLGRLIDPDV